MKKSLMMSVLIAGFAGLAATGVSYADDDDCTVPMADWQPREAVQKMAEGQGWTVRRIKTDDGCYEIKGRDAQGRKIEVKVDPGTLAVVEVEYDDDEDDGSRDVRPNTGPAGNIAPPDNGLFNRGNKPGTIEQ